MAVTLVKTLFTQTPKENVKNVTVSGWVRTMRESKAFAFVELNDGTYFRNLQVVLEEGRLLSREGCVLRLCREDGLWRATVPMLTGWMEE